MANRHIMPDWTKVDWTKTNLHLGICLGVSRNRVGAMRKQLGKPEVKSGYKWGRFAYGKRIGQ